MSPKAKQGFLNWMNLIPNLENRLSGSGSTTGLEGVPVAAGPQSYYLLSRLSFRVPHPLPGCRASQALETTQARGGLLDWLFVVTHSRAITAPKPHPFLPRLLARLSAPCTTLTRAVARMVRGDVVAAGAPSRKREQGRQMCRCCCHRRRGRVRGGAGAPGPLGSRAGSGAAPGLWRGGTRRWPHLGTPLA